MNQNGDSRMNQSEPEVCITSSRWLAPSGRLLVCISAWRGDDLAYEHPCLWKDLNPRACAREIARRTGADPALARKQLTDLLQEAKAWARKERKRVSREEEDFLAGFMGSAALAEAGETRTWLVNGLLVRDQPAVVGGPKKSLKTSLVIDLAVSLSTGTPFLDHFEVPAPVRVALLSGESGAGAIRDTAGRVCAARGLRLGDCQDLLWHFRLPRLSRQGDLDLLADFLRDQQLGVLVLDPLYLCLLERGSGLSATSVFDVGSVLAEVANLCMDAGTTPVFVHHAGKVSAAKKARAGRPLELEDLAFAGMAEFARQWVLVSHRSRYRPGSGRHELHLSVGGSAGQSGLYGVDVEEGVLAEDFTGRTWQVAVRPAEEEAVAGDGADPEGARAVEEAARDQILGFLASMPEGETTAEIRKQTRLGKSVVKKVLEDLSEQGLILPTTVRKQAGRGDVPHDAWKLTPDDGVQDEDEDEGVPEEADTPDLIVEEGSSPEEGGSDRVPARGVTLRRGGTGPRV
jgi:replicative DNA helicase